MVGGVSIGAFMGALWCMERDIQEVNRKARCWSFVSSTFLFFLFSYGAIILIFNLFRK